MASYELQMSSTSLPLPTPLVECCHRQNYHKGRPDTPVPSPWGSSSRAPKKEIVIAVMGVTGSGKSSLIREITGNPDVEVSRSLHSCTTKVTPYTFQYEGTAITLVDTPGFSDTHRSDLEILHEISAWATETYGQGHLLSGIVYLHRISDTRMNGSALKSLRLLKSLVGESNLKNVLLTTTHWSGVTAEEGEGREKELRETENFWKGLLDRGATLARYSGDRQSGLELLRKLVSSEPRPLGIQVELVDQRKKLVDTSAGQSVKREWSKWERTLKKFKKEIQIQREKPPEARASESDGVKEFPEHWWKQIQLGAARGGQRNAESSTSWPSRARTLTLTSVFSVSSGGSLHVLRRY